MRRKAVCFSRNLVLPHRKLIDISLVDDLFSGFITRFWEAAKPIVEEGRKQLNYPATENGLNTSTMK